MSTAAATGEPASVAGTALPSDPGQADASSDDSAGIGADGDQDGPGKARTRSSDSEVAEPGKGGWQLRAQAPEASEDRVLRSSASAADDSRPDSTAIPRPGSGSTVGHDEGAQPPGIVDTSAAPTHRATTTPETPVGAFTAQRGFVAEPPGSAGFGPAFAGEIDRLLLQGTQSAEILLTPRSLGPIRIELSMTGETASIAFTATQPETRHAIEQSLPLLRSLLAEHGLQLGQADVGSHDLRQGDHPLGQDQTGTVRDRGPADTTERTVLVHPTPGSRGLLDLFA